MVNDVRCLISAEDEGGEEGEEEEVGRGRGRPLGGRQICYTKFVLPAHPVPT